MRALRLLWKSTSTGLRVPSISTQFVHYSSATNPCRNHAAAVAQQSDLAYDAPVVFHSLNESFKLQPLSKDTCTRVLTIHPSSPHTGTTTLSIEEIDLTGNYEPFVAISHVWGSNPRHDRWVMCDGQYRRVTGRVDSLLHRIRNKLSEGDRYKHWNRIWIDTLCIDQAENALALQEKNRQVSMMHKIFGDAQEVLIDVGMADRYSHLLPAAKRDIIHLRQRAFDDEYCKYILGFPSSIKVDAQEADRIRRSLEACSRLLDKQWMCRVWAVQEYALARQCRFLIGNTVVDGDLLHELGKLAAQANIKGRSHLAMLFSKFRRALALTKLPRLDGIRQQGLGSTRKMSFGESLGLGWLHDCSDERDTVYALQALVDYRGPALKVDYNDPSHLLAQRVSRKLVELGDCEAVLAGARGLSVLPAENQPSWSFLMRPPFKFIGEERHWILSGKPNQFRAGGPRTNDKPPLTLNRDFEDRLEATVSVISTIERVTEKFPTIPQYGSNPKLPVERLYAYNTERTIHTRAVIVDAWLRHIIPTINRARKTKQLHLHSDELWRTITHGYNGMEFETRHANSQHRIKYWLMLVNMSLKGLEVLGYTQSRSGTVTLASDIRALEEAMRKRHLLISELMRKPREWIDAVHHEFDLSGDPRKKGIPRLLSKERAIASSRAQAVDSKSKVMSRDQMLKQVALNMYLVNEAFDIRKVRIMDQLKMLGRRLGVLQNGRLLSAPDAAEVGDVVVVFRGISVPYVLRRDGDHFKIVGMAYIDGLMHGEAVSDRTPWEKVQIT